MAPPSPPARNGRPPGEPPRPEACPQAPPPADAALAGPAFEDLLAGVADALPAGGDLLQLALLLSSRVQAAGAGAPTQLSLAEARYRALVEQLPAVTFLAPLDGSTSELYVSPQIEELLGFSAREWLEDPFLWMRQLHPDDRERWAEQFARTCFSG
jgi:PAS domain-containing protein